MRKSSKLLAVLLTLCLLFGAMTVIFASATEENPLQVTDVSLTSTEANTYEEAFTWVANSNYTSEYDLKNFDYVTLDFDFASETVLPTELQLKAMLGTYADDAALEAGTKKTATSGAFVIFAHEGAHYVGNYSKGTSANNITENGKLEKVEGAYDHITLVWQIVKTEGAVTAINQSLYVNGNFINTTVKKFTVTTPYNYFYGISGGAFTDASITIKNTAINHYATGAENTAALKTLSTAKSALYTSDVVVYKATYAVPGATDYVQIGDAKCYIPGAVSAFFADNLKDETVVTLNGISVEDVTIPEEVKSFTVKTQNDATFSLSDDSNAKYMAIETEDGVSYSKLRENVYDKGDAYRAGETTSTLPAGTSTGNYNVNITMLGDNKYHAAYDLENFDYATIDFDFAFTSDTFGKVRFAPSIAYTNGYDENGAYNSSNDYKSVATFGISKNASGDYYMGDVKLSNQKNVYDHFTILLALVNNTDGTLTVTPSIYVNGILAQTAEAVTLKDLTQHSLARLQYNYGAIAAGDRQSVTAVAKNHHYNLYEESTDIDSIVASGAPLYTIDDVVCNKDFVTLNKDTYATVNNYPYYVVNAAFANLKENETVTVYNVGNGYSLPGSFALKSFTIAVGAGEFSLAAEDAAKYETTPVAGNGYKYTKVRTTELDYTANDNILYTNDFSAKEGAASHTHSNSALGMSCENGTKGKGLKTSYITANGNTYARVHTDAAAAVTNRGGNFAIRPNVATEDRLRAFSYVTFDFDFCADQYTYAYGSREVETQNGKGVATGTATVPYYKTAASDAEFEEYIDSLDVDAATKAQYKAEGIASKALAYPADNSLAFSPFFMKESTEEDTAGRWYVASNADGRITLSKTFWICQNDGVWYACKAKNNFDGAIMLSNEVGVFDHYTIVMKITDNAAEEYTVTPMYYVNGQYLDSASSFKASKANFSMLYVDGMYGDQVQNPSGKHFDQYSLAFDNIALNYYTEADLANTTLDETIAAGDPLYAAENVVYNEGYVTPNKDRYATLDDDFKYYVIGAAFNKLGNCETIYLHNVGKYELPASLEINEFTAVVYEGDYEYTAADAARYTITKDGTVYTFVLARSYVLVDDVEYTLEEALELLGSANKLELVRTSLENFDAYEAGVKKLTVITDEYSNFSLAADIAWRYANINGTYVCAIDGMPQANLTLNSNVMNFRIYLPLPKTGTLSFVKAYTSLTGTSQDKNIKDGGTYVYNGQEYLVIFWSTRMDMSGKTAYAEFKYTDENSNEEILEARFEGNFDTIEYAKIVAESTTLFPCGGEAAQLVKAMTDYRVQTMTAFGKSTAAFSKAYDAFAKHPNCQCGNIKSEGDYIEVGQKQENFAFPEGVSVTYGISGNLYAMLINSTKGTAVEISYTNYNNEPVTDTVQISSGVAAFGTHAADIDNKFTITILNVEGEGEDAVSTVVAEFTYSLADYTPTTEADAAIITALKNYALAAENYKNDPKEN